MPSSGVRRLRNNRAAKRKLPRIIPAFNRRRRRSKLPPRIIA